MPRVKPLSSLSNLCLENVANYMDNWCVSRDGIDIFSYLPSHSLTSLLDLLRKKKNLKRKHLELLLTKRLTVFDLSEEDKNGGSNDVSEYLRLASARCPELTTMNLKGNWRKLSKNYLEEVYFLPWLPHFPNLQVLDISYTNANDMCLAVLGVYCTQLKELSVINCLISDDGIRKLCVSDDDDKRVGQCKAIRKLSVIGSSITKDGIELALDNLPGLEEIDCTYLAQLMAERQSRKQADILLPQYSLTHFAYYYDKAFPYTSGTIALAVSMCPSIVCAKFEFNNQDGLEDADILGLLALKTLQELWILVDWVQGSRITFNGGVVPLLQKFGSSLDSLCIDVPHTSLSLIMKLCPNLRSLSLYYKGLERTSGTVRQRSRQGPIPRWKPELKFEKLEKLVLMVDRRFEEIPTDDLILLFSSSPALMNTYVSNCENLTDAVLEKILKKNLFHNLKILKLYACPGITKKGIELLMRESNPLNLIHWFSNNNNGGIVEFCKMWNAAAQMRKWDFVLENWDPHADLLL